MNYDNQTGYKGAQGGLTFSLMIAIVIN